MLMGFLGILKGILVRLLALLIGLIFLSTGYSVLNMVLIHGQEIFLEFGKPLSDIFFYGSLIFGVVFSYYGLKCILGAIGILPLNDEKKRQDQIKDTAYYNFNVEDTVVKSNKQIEVSKNETKPLRKCKYCKSLMGNDKGSVCIKCKRKMSYISNQPPPWQR
jgi:predicted membrane protein